ncbi:hypothetical protein DVH24_003507 [Malus domestica]|uniref:S-locus receptor kinase C-terminal domain-containing protein n=1 Tax=Malus domestica TaxID=3750 RepID=A0A498IIQ3_MALDO|nr:hypothetical protein DVH24_003507 [Malus domestica]
MEDEEIEERKEDDLELPLFDLPTIETATNYFSINNKLGEGGFGPVYKAWRLWKEGRPLELIDKGLGNSCTLSEVLRCIHVSLLCVQQQPEDRPTMSSVVQMLCSESALPQPKEPGFVPEKGLLDGVINPSCNGLTITELEAR